MASSADIQPLLSAMQNGFFPALVGLYLEYANLGQEAARALAECLASGCCPHLGDSPSGGVILAQRLLMP